MTEISTNDLDLFKRISDNVNLNRRMFINFDLSSDIASQFYKTEIYEQLYDSEHASEIIGLMVAADEKGYPVFKIHINDDAPEQTKEYYKTFNGKYFIYHHGLIHMAVPIGVDIMPIPQLC